MQIYETFRHLFHPRRSNNHRARVLHPEAYVYYILLAIGFFASLQSLRYLPGSLGDVLGFASSITPTQIIDQTNQQRAAVGLPPLTHNSRLSAAALAKGQDMFSDQYWAHTAPDGKQPWSFMREAGYSYKVAGENLARDFGSTSEVVSAWMASPTHRANIVNNRYQEIGVAVIDGTLEGVETTLVVQMFGSSGAVAQVTEGTTTQSPAPTKRPAATTKPAAQPSPVLTSPIPTSQPSELVSIEQAPTPNETPTVVLANALINTGSLSSPPLFSPLQMSKAFFLAIILLIILTLVYDGLVSGNYNTVRLVGKNLGHIIFLTVIAFLLILFKGGIIT